MKIFGVLLLFRVIFPGKAVEATSETLLGLIAYRFDAPLFFANTDHFLTQARELIASIIE